MMSFRKFVEQGELGVDTSLAATGHETAPSIQSGGVSQKPWSATKDEVLTIWKNMRPDLPIYMTPMSSHPAGNKGHSSYGEDGIRITGSWQFIASVMSRLKNIVAYENPETKLRLVFRGVDPNRMSEPNRQAFAFYVNLEKRKKGKAGRPVG